MDAIKLTQSFVRCESETHDSNTEVTSLMRRALVDLGFEIHLHEYKDRQGTPKQALSARRLGRPVNAVGSPAQGAAYFCHNDVVSVDGWDCIHGGPFEGAIAEDRLWGRGACDMKGSAAVALSALSRIDQAEQQGPLYYFVTGDEECGMAGAALLSQSCDWYAEVAAQKSVAIVGEPTELQLVNAHKGGCHIKVAARGVAAHSSTREGRNANWQLIPFLTYLEGVQQRCQSQADLLNSAFDPPTLSLNPVLENHPAAANITVGRAVCQIFLRPMPATNWEDLVTEICDRARELELEVDLQLSLPPVHTADDGPFVQETLSLLGQREPLSVCYATDGCSFSQLENLIVLGPGSIEQAHRPDEWIALDQLRRGVDVFHAIFSRYSCSPAS